MDEHFAFVATARVASAMLGAMALSGCKPNHSIWQLADERRDRISPSKLHADVEHARIRRRHERMLEREI